MLSCYLGIKKTGLSLVFNKKENFTLSIKMKFQKFLKKHKEIEIMLKITFFHV